MNLITSPKEPVTKPSHEKLLEPVASLNTENLFPNGCRERTIVHDDTEYRLRITALGKLILTK